MGYNNEFADISPLVLDIETAPLVNARDFIDPPDLTEIKAPSNYKDPVKIAAFIEDAKVEKLADFEKACRDKAALDFNVARIVAMGTWADDYGLTADCLMSEADEHACLSRFWQFSRQRTIVGFRIREFDLPMMLQRSRYLGITAPQIDLGRYARGGRIVDLHDLLTFQDLRSETIMRRTAKSFARRFGIQVDDPIDGKQIPALVAAGDWAAVASHVRSDVLLEVELARKLGVITTPVAEMTL